MSASPRFRSRSRAPTRLPALVPITISARMPASSSTLRAPACASRVRRRRRERTPSAGGSRERRDGGLRARRVLGRGRCSRRDRREAHERDGGRRPCGACAGSIASTRSAAAASAPAGLRLARAPGATAAREALERAERRLPAETRIGDALTVGERAGPARDPAVRQRDGSRPSRRRCAARRLDLCAMSSITTVCRSCCLALFAWLASIMRRARVPPHRASGTRAATLARRSSASCRRAGSRDSRDCRGRGDRRAAVLRDGQEMMRMRGG